MNINSVLRKEGIEVTQELDVKQVKSIASNVASKLCLAFPDYSLSRKNLYDSLCNIKMYLANMPVDSSGAKYFYNNNSIYFNQNLSFSKILEIAIHECIHFIQAVPNVHNRIIRMGLYDFSSGLGINEATVQLMASEANNETPSQEMYYGISLKTISPDYYPLECALVNQLAYFTGTYPLYHSTLNSNNIFKNTFIIKSSKKTYSTVIKNLDKLLDLENSLNFFSSELKYVNKISEIKSLNLLIASKKKLIIKLFFETQNLIMEQFFNNELNNIKNLTDAKLFKKRLYNFKKIIGISDEYSFYNYFYVDMMDKLSEKELYIQEYGAINSFVESNYSLVATQNTSISFAKIFFTKLRKLFATKEDLPSYWQQ